MFSTHKRGHPVLFVALLVVAVYVILSGTVAMSSGRRCSPGWDPQWNVIPPGWECHRSAGR